MSTKIWQYTLQSYIHYLKLERGLAENSIESYELDLLKFVQFLSHSEIEVAPKNVTPAHVNEFVYQLSTVLAPTSQARIISGLKSFFTFLLVDGQIEKSPTDLLEIPKLGRKLPEVLAMEEVDAMLATLDLSTNEGYRNKVMMELLYSCGLRVSELVNLRLSDLFFEEGFIRVIGKGSKHRFVPIDPDTMELITMYKQSIRNQMQVKKEDTDIVFLNRRGGRLTRAMIFTIVKQAAQEANIQKNVSPHSFRHSFATYLLENGADIRMIQLMLGHESILTTEIYTHISREKLKGVMDRYHPRSRQ
ncbi:site-specific tyrosine recombinase XerD [Myroides odoratus]|uniref:Tyrosine recombinase XerC n=1 Tax=Myroides odoratus TaxID=256 RepID=A0A378RHT4_MYROD|nr:site-specific tyrosine recombinase XerD [Myroides odoratus]QQU02511.1 site-specific tyrosine recombinase XerD [Myroides odoratus]STZ26534.1 Tyrosine recombinase XerD [Myroides odoratus]